MPFCHGLAACIYQVCAPSTQIMCKGCQGLNFRNGKESKKNIESDEEDVLHVPTFFL